MAFLRQRLPPLLIELLRPYRRLIVGSLAATVVQMATGLAAPWPLKSVLDNVVGNHPAPLWISWLLPILGGSGKVQLAAAAGILTVLIAAVAGAAMYVGSYLTERLGQSIGNDLRVRLYHHLQELSLAYYDTNRVGAILNTLTGDVQTIQSFASTSTLTIVTDVLSLVGMIVVMFLLRWDFALIAIAVTPLLVLFALRVNKAVRSAVSEVRNRQSDLLATLQEGLQSIEVVKAFSREDRQEQQLQQVSSQTVTAWLQARRVSALLAPVVTLAVAVCTGLVLWRGSLLVLSGAMTIGSLSVFLAYLARFFQPVRDLTQMTNTIAAVSVGFQRVTAVCDADTVIPERPAPKDPAPFRGEIAFENASLAYDPDVPVLRDITFDVSPGEMVGIVGPTGSGKSTAMSLIPRFRDRDAGRISIDGVDICDFKLHGLRTQIGFVLQDTVLLRGTVAENIAFGRPNATAEQIVRAAERANADEFIRRMPDGYDSMIAHRLSTLRDADKIVVIKDGVVIENGPHQQLLALNGVYAGLHRLQFGDH